MDVKRTVRLTGPGEEIGGYSLFNQNELDNNFAAINQIQVMRDSQELYNLLKIMPKGTNKPMPTFIRKLHQILSDQQLEPNIHWDQTGSFVCIVSIGKFQKHVLPKFFRHSKFSSFVRQLNIYGFSKRRSRQGVQATFSSSRFTRHTFGCESIKKDNSPINKKEDSCVSSKSESFPLWEQFLSLQSTKERQGLNKLQSFSDSDKHSSTVQPDLPEINQLLGELEPELNSPSDDPLWEMELKDRLRKPRYRKIEKQILGLWQINPCCEIPNSMWSRQLEFIL